jgi:hypothetical protein
MLTAKLFNTIKTSLASVLDDPAFHQLPVEAQLTALLTGSPDELQAPIKAFLLAYRVKTGATLANSPDHYALREQLVRQATPVGQWHKANPPKSAFALMNQAHQPSWSSEYYAIPSIADRVSFDMLAKPQWINYEVLSYFGIGGAEDSGDSRSLMNPETPGHDTLNILVEGVYNHLMVLRPEWFGANGQPLQVLPESASPDSRYDIEEARRQEAVAQRRLEAEQRRLERLEAKKASAAARQEALRKKLDGFDWMSLVPATCEELRSTLDNAEARGSLFAMALAPVVQELSAGGLNVDERVLRDLVDDAEIVFLEALREAHPAWVRENADGSLACRAHAIKGDKGSSTATVGGLTMRAEKAIRNAISGLCEKYGMEYVNAIAQQVFQGEYDNMPSEAAPTDSVPPADLPEPPADLPPLI